MFSKARNCVDVSHSGRRFAVLQDSDLLVYTTDSWKLIQKLSLNRIIEDLNPIVTHVRMYFDAHVVLQTFDATITVLNFNDGKTVYQWVDEDGRASLDNSLLEAERNIAFTRRNKVWLLKRIEDAGQ